MGQDVGIENASRVPSFLLRPATDADFEFLYELNTATIQIYADQTYGPSDEASTRRRFTAYFNPASTQILVVEGQSAGMLQVQHTDDAVRLVNVRVAPAFQGQGIGTRLILDVLDDAHVRGVLVTLRVLRVNPARLLYERLGFGVVGETETHYLMEARPPASQNRAANVGTSEAAPG